MGYLNGKSAYLAGPITAVSDDGLGWRQWITPQLVEKYSLKVYDPTKQKSITGRVEIADDKKHFENLAKEKKFDQLREEFVPILRKDLRLVDKADFVIATYSPKIHMFGTIAEMLIASFLQRKPILCYCAPEEITGINPWLLAYVKEGCLFSDWNDIFKYLDKVDKGEVDPRYWTISEGE